MIYALFRLMARNKYPQGFRELYAIEYASWRGMRWRCNNPDDRAYHGAGVKVCARWDNFQRFVEDMGVRPGVEWSIERINPADDYRPENCYWAKLVDQSSNKRNTLPLIERIHPRLRPVFRRTVEVVRLEDDATWGDIADGWLPRHRRRPLY